jgi:BirA family biotin operon repressor/biotin-[acetyl-CoA-carboxylase] ligase
MRLNFGVAWGLARLFNQQQIPVALKWPNDLLLCNRKLGGILTETRLRGGARGTGIIHRAVIGIGINGWNPVPGNGINLESFWAMQADPPAPLQRLEDLAALTLLGLQQGLTHWLNPTLTLAQLLPDYEQWLVLYGQSVEVAGNLGRILGVTPAGALRIRFGATEAQFPPGSLAFQPFNTMDRTDKIWRCTLLSQ